MRHLFLSHMSFECHMMIFGCHMMAKDSLVSTSIVYVKYELRNKYDRQ